MKGKKLAPIKLTEDQHAWLVKESKETGNPMAAIVRGLIQLQVIKRTMK